jgi:hypothetical protein
MEAEVAMAADGSALWAFLIGIDKYESTSLVQKSLRGCVNDVEAMRIFLLNQLNVPSNHICLLTNQQATRATILQTFQTFLIHNPAIAYGDQILFHYSGHGSRRPDPTGKEPDGYNETIVPYDGRTLGVYDIPDTTLAALLERLAASKGKHITVILDCCHSGSGTRGIELPGMPCTRVLPIDSRIPPPDLDADLQLPESLGLRPSTDSRHSYQLPYVLLAGCRDRELSNEYQGKSEDGQENWYGALTYFILYNLRQIAPGTTYAELSERVAAQVSTFYPGQNPQCEGDRQRMIFGRVSIERDALIPVKQRDGEEVTLIAGLVHGLRVGTELAIYPPEVRTLADLPSESLATVEVVSVSATTAQAHFQQVPAQPLPPHARAVITKHVYIGLRQLLALRAADDEESQQAIKRVRQVVERATPDRKPSLYLEIVDDSTRAVDFYVEAARGKMHVYSANGELLAVPEAILQQGFRDARLILRTLECICRYRTLQALLNENSRSQLRGEIKLRLRRYKVDSQGDRQAEDLPESSVSAGGELTIGVDPHHEEQNLYVVDVMNNSPLWIYPHVFLLNPDYGIERFYPRFGQEEALRPGGVLAIGLGSQDRPLRFELPEGWETSRDYFKLIVTTNPSDLDILQQHPLRVPVPRRGRVHPVENALDQLLETILYHIGMRNMRSASATGEDWTTVELPITTVLIKSSQAEKA